MSLRFRLISLIAIVLAANLTVEAAIVSFHASRSVRTEMNSALQVGRQFVENALADLPNSKDPRGDIETLVAAFKGNRHLRVSQSGGATFVAPSLEGSHFGMVPRWFVRLLGITPLTARVPIAIAGQNYGSILIETDPNNEILEVWNDLGDGFVVSALFFGLNILLIYVSYGPGFRPLDQLAGALQQIGHGDYKLRIGGHMVPELSRLQWSFNRMATELAELDGGKALPERAAIDVAGRRPPNRSHVTCTTKLAHSFSPSTLASRRSRSLFIKATVPRSPEKFSRLRKRSPTYNGKSGRCQPLAPWCSG